MLNFYIYNLKNNIKNSNANIRNFVKDKNINAKV